MIEKPIPSRATRPAGTPNPIPIFAGVLSPDELADGEEEGAELGRDVDCVNIVAVEIVLEVNLKIADGFETVLGTKTEDCG